MNTDSRPILFILNAASGNNRDLGAIQASIRERFAGAAREVRVILSTSGEEIKREARNGIAGGAGVVVAGGGDGTIATVAAELLDSGVTLGVLPLGTLNHFAKDLGIPLELEAALDVLVSANAVGVDVGEVNGRIFLNNSSLGLYAWSVGLRKQHPAKGLKKWLVSAWALRKVMERNQSFIVRVNADGTSVVRHSCLVLVGNNAYRMAGINAGTRESISGGKLAVYVVKSHGRMRLAGLLWKIVNGNAEQGDELEVHCVSEAVVEIDAARAAVVLDGELHQLEMPLRYAIRKRVLQVLAPG